MAFKWSGLLAQEGSTCKCSEEWLKDWPQRVTLWWDRLWKSQGLCVVDTVFLFRIRAGLNVTRARLDTIWVKYGVKAYFTDCTSHFKELGDQREEPRNLLPKQGLSQRPCSLSGSGITKFCLLSRLQRATMSTLIFLSAA